MLFALFGLYAFTVAVQGRQRYKLAPPARLLMAVCSVALLWPAVGFISAASRY